jgi:hypothetical protein
MQPSEEKLTAKPERALVAQGRLAAFDSAISEVRASDNSNYVRPF